MTSTSANAASAIAAMTTARGARRAEREPNRAVELKRELTRHRRLRPCWGRRVSAPERIGREFAGDAPIAQHDQPVADGEEFVEILGDQQHRSAGLRARRGTRSRTASALRASRPRVG